jgi:hypothetical protein
VEFYELIEALPDGSTRWCRPLLDLPGGVIGDYWECVLPRGTDMPPLQRLASETTMLAQQHFKSWRFAPDGRTSEAPSSRSWAPQQAICGRSYTS